MPVEFLRGLRGDFPELVRDGPGMFPDGAHHAADEIQLDEGPGQDKQRQLPAGPEHHAEHRDQGHDIPDQAAHEGHDRGGPVLDVRHDPRGEVTGFVPGVEMGTQSLQVTPQPHAQGEKDAHGHPAHGDDAHGGERFEDDQEPRDAQQDPHQVLFHPGEVAGGGLVHHKPDQLGDRRQQGGLDGGHQQAGQ